MSAAEPNRAIQMSILSSEMALHNWDVIGGLLDRAIPYTRGRLDMQHVLDKVRDGVSGVVIAWDPSDGKTYAAFLCDINQYPTGLKCWCVRLCGGYEVEEWGHLYSTMKAIAREHGCEQIEIVGRPGWGKILGFSETSRMYIEDL